jgi:hypothetical protein
MKSSAFLDKMSFDLLKYNRRFGEKYRFYFQSRREMQARNQREAVSLLTAGSRCILESLIPQTEV